MSNIMKNRNCDSDIIMNINTTLILTPLTCASVISEILKCLIYEKSQIPYPYNWLKNLVETKKKQSSESVTNNVFIEKQNRLITTAFESIEAITTNIKNLFKLGIKINEIMVLFGATPLNPREVYRFNIPKLANGHNERNHFNLVTKSQHKILRRIVLSQEWMTKMEKSLPLTNLFVFVRICNNNSVILDNRTLEGFLPASSFYLPKNIQVLTVNLLYDDSVDCNNCCTVYEDEDLKQECNQVEISEKNESKKELVELNDVDWLQVNSVLKGYKETSFINKSKNCS